MSVKIAKRTGIFMLVIILCFGMVPAVAYAESGNPARESIQAVEAPRAVLLASAAAEKDLGGAILADEACTADENVEDEEITRAAKPEEITDDDTPLAIMPTWSVLNLIVMILTVCTGAGMIISYFKINEDMNREDDETGGEFTDGEKTEIERKRSKFLGLIPGIGSLVTFFLTEDMSSHMVITDRWTALMLALLVIGAALAWLTRNEKPEEEPEEV